MFIQIQNVNKRFGNFTALNNINLEIKKNEIFVLLGPSGCGKTTLMRIISGFELPNEGKIFIGNKEYTYATPQERPTNMVFQSYAIFQNMSVFNNVAYGLRILKTPKSEIFERVEKMLQLTDMWSKRNAMPANLSGGQCQRVALARALIMEPEVLLLDEPLSALDAKLRNNMREELIRLQECLKITFVMVTHDQGEALAIADRIAIMENGEVKQVGTPEDIYALPRSIYVADFIGEMNWFKVSEVEMGDVVSCVVPEFGKITIPNMTKRIFSKNTITHMGVRLENVKPYFENENENPEKNLYFSGIIRQIIYYGNYQKIILTILGKDIMISMHVKTELGFSKGDTVKAKIPKDKILLFDH